MHSVSFTLHTSHRVCYIKVSLQLRQGKLKICTIQAVCQTKTCYVIAYQSQITVWIMYKFNLKLTGTVDCRRKCVIYLNKIWIREYSDVSRLLNVFWFFFYSFSKYAVTTAEPVGFYIRLIQEYDNECCHLEVLRNSIAYFMCSLALKRIKYTVGGKGNIWARGQKVRNNAQSYVRMRKLRNLYTSQHISTVTKSRIMR
jgi:hypothetical protein